MLKLICEATTGHLNCQRNKNRKIVKYIVDFLYAGPCSMGDRNMNIGLGLHYGQQRAVSMGIKLRRMERRN